MAIPAQAWVIEASGFKMATDRPAIPRRPNRYAPGLVRSANLPAAQVGRYGDNILIAVTQALPID
jgi:hypothetical protein